MSKKEAVLNSPRHYVIYTYDLTKISASKKVRFVYLLKGRKRQIGLVEFLEGRFLANGCFLLPVGNDKEMQDVFSQWQVPFKREEVLLL